MSRKLLRLYRRDGETWALHQSGADLVYDAELGEDLIVLGDAAVGAARMLLFDGSEWIEGPVLATALASPRSLTLGDDLLVVGDIGGGENAETLRRGPRLPLRRARLVRGPQALGQRRSRERQVR